MRKLLNFKKNYFYFFLFLYLILGIFLSLSVGITHDESHDLLVWNLNKQLILNFLFGNNYDVSFLESGGKYYGFGFHIASFPIEIFINSISNFIDIKDNARVLVNKHATVFLFYVISSLYFNKILFYITKNKEYSFACTLLYLLYPYLLGHSFFNIKDIPFLSVWLIATFYIIKISKCLINHNIIRFKDLFILSILTAYLLSIRISGILIFLEYFIVFLFLTNILNIRIKDFIIKFYKQFFIFFFTVIILFYILHPSYWLNPLAVIDGIKYMSQHLQTVCTVTMGKCMKAQNLPSSYLPLWLMFKLPLLVLCGLLIFPLIEKKLFKDKINTLIIGSLIITTISIILLLILFNTNLYDEIRQVMFLVPLLFVISLSSIYFLSKKISLITVVFFSVIFVYQNVKIYPYNYIWINNFSNFIKVGDNFELDYWGVSTKMIAKKLNNENIEIDNCIITNRIDGVKAFVSDMNTCFLPIQKLHSKNTRPFYVALTERSLNKGLPNNCVNIFNEKIKLNFSKEELILAKLYRCD